MEYLGDKGRGRQVIGMMHFTFVDHNSAIMNDASDALRELSKHMINQAMDTRVTPLQESVVLKEKLNAFKEKLEAETLTAEEVDAVIAEFEVLQKASKTYRCRRKRGDQRSDRILAELLG